MRDLPTITTQRLLLRPFAHEDAPVVQRLAGDRRIADTTLAIPHPYPEGAAEAWIATHEAAWELGRGMVLAVVLRHTGELAGAIGLTIQPEHRSAELGYWIGVEYWNHGYCTEAARAVIAFAFTQLDLNRVHAHHFARNPASGRVLVKSGLKPEGSRAAAVMKWGRPEDICLYGVSRAEWEQARSRS